MSIEVPDSEAPPEQWTAQLPFVDPERITALEKLFSSVNIDDLAILHPIAIEYAGPALEKDTSDKQEYMAEWESLWGTLLFVIAILPNRHEKVVKLVFTLWRLRRLDPILKDLPFFAEW